MICTDMSRLMSGREWNKAVKGAKTANRLNSEASSRLEDFPACNISVWWLIRVAYDANIIHDNPDRFWHQIMEALTLEI